MLNKVLAVPFSVYKTIVNTNNGRLKFACLNVYCKKQYNYTE